MRRPCGQPYSHRIIPYLEKSRKYGPLLVHYLRLVFHRCLWSNQSHHRSLGSSCTDLRFPRSRNRCILGRCPLLRRFHHHNRPSDHTAYSHPRKRRFYIYMCIEMDMVNIFLYRNRRLNNRQLQPSKYQFGFYHDVCTSPDSRDDLIFDVDCKEGKSMVTKQCNILSHWFAAGRVDGPEKSSSLGDSKGSPRCITGNSNI